MSNLAANNEERNSTLWASACDTQAPLEELPTKGLIEELTAAICSKTDQFFDFVIELGIEESISNKLYKWQAETGSSLCWRLTRSKWNENLDRKEIAEFYLEFNLTKNRGISNMPDLVQAEIQQSIAQKERLVEAYNKMFEGKICNTLDEIVATSVNDLLLNNLPVIKIQDFQDEKGMYVANCISDSEFGFRLTFIIDSEFKLNGESPSRTFIISRPSKDHDNVYVNFSDNIVTDISEQKVLSQIAESDIRLLRKAGSILLTWLDTVMVEPR